jgi:hypothetical protein
VKPLNKGFKGGIGFSSKRYQGVIYHLANSWGEEAILGI